MCMYSHAYYSENGKIEYIGEYLEINIGGYIRWSRYEYRVLEILNDTCITSTYALDEHYSLISQCGKNYFARDFSARTTNLAKQCANTYNVKKKIAMVKKEYPCPYYNV